MILVSNDVAEVFLAKLKDEVDLARFHVDAQQLDEVCVVVLVELSECRDLAQHLRRDTLTALSAIVSHLESVQITCV